MSTPQAEARLQMRPRVMCQPQCPYCGEDAVLVDKSVVYRQGDGGKVWLCEPCRAWVGVEIGSRGNTPKGRLAKSLLRAKKVKAFFYFDRVWRWVAEQHNWSEWKARHAAYGWLAEQMGIKPEDCHIGFFDDAATQVVIDICMAVGAKKDVAA